MRFATPPSIQGESTDRGAAERFHRSGVTSLGYERELQTQLDARGSQQANRELVLGCGVDKQTADYRNCCA